MVAPRPPGAQTKTKPLPDPFDSSLAIVALSLKYRCKILNMRIIQESAILYGDGAVVRPIYKSARNRKILTSQGGQI